MKRLPYFFLSVILLFFIGISILSALHESLTYDEIVDLQEGRNAVLYHTFDIDPYNPPLTREIGVLPYIFTKEFYMNPTYVYSHSLAGRICMILLGEILLFCVWQFTRTFFGEKEAFFATFLLALEPTILANSHYLTMDIGVTLFFFISYWMLLATFSKPSLKHYIMLGFFTGLGIASKISFIPYFLLSIIFVVIQHFMIIKESWKKFQLRYVVVSLVVCTCIIWGAYFFKSNVIIKSRSDSSRVSQKLLTYAATHHNALLKNVVVLGEKQKIPLGDFAATLKNNALRSLQKSQCFFFGKYYSSCSWYFIIGNFFVKTPLPLIILFCIAVCRISYQKKKNTYIKLILPISAIVIVAAIFKMQPLVRYILPLYPFFIIFASLSLSFFLKKTWRKIALGGLIIWYVYSSLSSFPHFISYANELAGNKKYMILTDSNLDWGQSLPDVAQFHANNPSTQIHFSYFGRDNGDLYGLRSNTSYGSYKENEICAFHTIGTNSSKEVTLINISNWWECGYYQTKEYNRKNITGVLHGTLLIFK